MPDGQALRALIDACPSRVSVVTADHRYLYANPEFLNFIGIPLESLIGRAARDVLGQDVYAAFSATARQLRPDHSPRWEGWINFANGARRNIEVTMVPYTPVGNVIDAIFVFARDLSDVKQQEQELRESLASLQQSESARNASEQVNTQIVRSALDAFILADSDGKIRDFNPAAEDMLGYRREDAVGKLLSELIIPHEHRAAHDAGMKRYMATGVSRVLGKRMQLEALAVTGERIPVEVTLNEVKLPDQHLFTAHMRDLRESRRQQAEIEAQRSRITQIEKLSAMGSLLAGVAHELNNPLAILLAQATLLREKAPSGDIRQRAERIHAAAERAGRIVKSFLALAREKPPVRELSDLNQVIDNTLQMLAYGLRTAGIEVEKHLDPGMPRLRIDSDMIGQVIANIVLNSQQVLMNHPRPRILTLRTHAAIDHATLEIADNGPGVPAEVADRIFDPFFTTKPAGVGTGIGLAICKDIIQAHGGKLELASGPARGALFRITLPHAAEEPANAESAEEQGAGERILVVDDEVDVGESLGEILDALGHRVTVTASALRGLDMLRAEPFDRVFVDLRMPEISGHEFLRELHEMQPAVAARSVLMTGDTVRGPATLLGGVDVHVMEKPFSFDDIRTALARA
ncbi:MAG: PAS domain S-box protein [Beijerinckiaceae bacterium]|nr:PAS domain S-box protein [Beijerinckiaceae bacterium]MCZ8301512.1 PAS domain S-box protein [Beijerinckiaceae bacterium]